MRPAMRIVLPRRKNGVKLAPSTRYGNGSERM